LHLIRFGPFLDHTFDKWGKGGKAGWIPKARLSMG
jgi:hypothetical protein